MPNTHAVVEEEGDGCARYRTTYPEVLDGFAHCIRADGAVVSVDRIPCWVLQQKGAGSAEASPQAASLIALHVGQRVGVRDLPGSTSGRRLCDDTGVTAEVVGLATYLKAVREANG